MKLLPCLALAASLSFSAVGVSADTQKTPIEADLYAFNDRFNALAASGDAAGLVDLYAADSLWIAPGEGPVPGPAGAKTTFNFMKAQNGQNVHSIDHLFISDDGTMAVMVGEAEILVESADMDFTGTYQFVLRKEGNDWNIISDMYTVPASEQQ